MIHSHSFHRRLTSLAAVAVAVGTALAPAAAQVGAPRASQAESYVRENWTVADGLPINSITAILQTRDGYLWLGTNDGVVRFDGVRFTVYNAGNTPGLPSNRIVSLYEDRAGALWIITEQAAGRSSRLVQRTTPEFGHCTFTPQEVAQGFSDLVAWVEQGVEPAP